MMKGFFLKRGMLYSSGNLPYLGALVGSTFLMGSSFVASKTLLTSIPPFPLVGWRFFVAAIATLPFALAGSYKQFSSWTGIVQGATNTPWRAVVMLGLLQITVVMGLLFLSMEQVSAATASILLFTNPIWVASLSPLVLSERLNGSRIVGLALGILGVMLVIGAGVESREWLGNLLGLGSAWAWAAATLITKRSQLLISAWSLSFWQMFIGSVGLLSIAALLGESWPTAVSAKEWAWFFWLAIPASTGSYGLWFVALQRGGATSTSGFLFLAPLFTIVLSNIVLHTGISWTQGVGGILICKALHLVNRSPAGRKFSIVQGVQSNDVRNEDRNST